MCESLGTLSLLQKMVFFISVAGVFFSVIAFFRIFRSGNKKLYLLWIVPIFWQSLGYGLGVLCDGTFWASTIWRGGLLVSLLCILVSGWLFIAFRRVKKGGEYSKVVLPGLALQVALLVSALVYGF